MISSSNICDWDCNAYQATNTDAQNLSKPASIHAAEDNYSQIYTSNNYNAAVK